MGISACTMNGFSEARLMTALGKQSPFTAEGQYWLS
jgi:hypothetical protein